MTKTTATKTETTQGTLTGQGGAGRGQGRKPMDPAFRRSHSIAVKCTEAEYDALAAKAEREESYLASWVRTAALAAQCVLAGMMVAGLVACGSDAGQGDPSDGPDGEPDATVQPVDGGEPAQAKPTTCQALQGSWFLDMTLQNTSRGSCPARWTAAVVYDAQAVRSADRCTTTITSTDDDGGVIVLAITQLDGKARSATVTADLRHVEGTPDCRGTYNALFSVGL